MDHGMLQRAVREGRLRWRQHALQRMLQRGITRALVREAILRGEVIEEYPEDSPYPSALLLALVEGRPLHVLVALNVASQYAYVITAYEPGLDRFEPDFRTRRR